MIIYIPVGYNALWALLPFWAEIFYGLVVSMGIIFWSFISGGLVVRKRIFGRYLVEILFVVGRSFLDCRGA